jgi:hypothetical protein
MCLIAPDFLFAEIPKPHGQCGPHGPPDQSGPSSHLTNSPARMNRTWRSAGDAAAWLRWRLRGRVRVDTGRCSHMWPVTWAEGEPRGAARRGSYRMSGRLYCTSPGHSARHPMSSRRNGGVPPARADPSAMRDLCRATTTAGRRILGVGLWSDSVNSRRCYVVRAA